MSVYGSARTAQSRDTRSRTRGPLPPARLRWPVGSRLKAGVIEKGWFTPPRIEGTIHQAVTAAGARRTRYAGLGKTALAHILTATAVNLVRLDAWWSGQPLAPTRTSHLAALDLAA
ncbi:transposase [Streptomyces mirabilis]|uniref:transposase n=1 Tax=Streptomyces mirabilis TaxID=68239 RepID=UPI0036DAEBA7